MSFDPGSQAGRLTAAFAQGVPNRRRQVGRLAGVENALDGGQHRNRWDKAEGGNVPEAIELQTERSLSSAS